MVQLSNIPARYQHQFGPCSSSDQPFYQGPLSVLTLDPSLQCLTPIILRSGSILPGLGPRPSPRYPCGHISWIWTRVTTHQLLPSVWATIASHMKFGMKSEPESVECSWEPTSPLDWIRARSHLLLAPVVYSRPSWHWPTQLNHLRVGNSPRFAPTLPS
jgi:hypothetical protein